MRALGVKDLRTDFVLERVIYADGTRDVFAESLRHNVVITGLEPDEEDFAMAYRRMLSAGSG